MAASLPPRRLRHRRRRRRDPRRAPARLPRRAPGVRAMTAGRDGRLATARRAARCRRGARCAGAAGLCGLGSGLIPAADAGPLQQRLRSRRTGGRKRQRQLLRDRNSDRQDRTGLHRAARRHVDAGLRDTLRQGIANLRTRALALCAQPLARPAPPSTTPTSTTTTTTHRDDHARRPRPAPRRRPPRPRPAPRPPRPAPGGGTPPGRAKRAGGTARTGRHRGRRRNGEAAEGGGRRRRSARGGQEGGK